MKCNLQTWLIFLNASCASSLIIMTRERSRRPQKAHTLKCGDNAGRDEAKKPSASECFPPSAPNRLEKTSRENFRWNTNRICCFKNLIINWMSSVWYSLHNTEISVLPHPFFNLIHSPALGFASLARWSHKGMQNQPLVRIKSTACA